MNQHSSGSLIDRILAWLRGFFAAGRSTTDTAARDVRGAADPVREDIDDTGQRIRDLASHRDRRDAAARAAGQDLPDLPDESRTGTDRPSLDPTSTSASPARASEPPTDAEVSVRSDFDDAAGDLETGEEPYPSAAADIDAATHVHDAVGGEDERADASTDGIVDTTRDDDLTPGGAEGFQDREIPLQDNLIVSEGASSDEFDGDEITVGDIDTRYVSPADVEAAAVGYGDTTDTDLPNTSDAGTSALTGSTYTETDVTVPPDTAGGTGGDTSGAGEPREPDRGGDRRGGFHVVERYNYGQGDLGVGAGTTPSDAWDDDAGPEVTTADIDTGVDADINATGRDAGATRSTGDTGAGNRAAAHGTTAGEDVSAQPIGGGFVESVDDVPPGAIRGTPGDIDASVSPEATRAEIESQSRGDAVNKSDDATQAPGFGPPETFAEAEAGTIEPSRSATGDELEDDEGDALGTTLDYSDESDSFDEDAANLSSEDELAVTDEDVDFGSGRGGTERVATFQSGTIAHEGLIDAEPAIDRDVTDAAYADLPDEPRHETADDSALDDFSGSDYPSDRRVDTLDGDDFTDAEVPDVPDLDSSAGDLSAVSTDASEQVDYVTEPVERTVGDAGSHLDQDLVSTSDEHVGGEEPELAEDAGDDVPAGAVRGDGTTSTPAGYPVKGNAGSMIYHLPSFPSYKTTKAEFCFATEQDAINAGFRAPGKRNRGKKS